MQLAKNNVGMRIATIVTKRNLEELETIADWVHALGVETYAITPVVKLVMLILGTLSFYFGSYLQEGLDRRDRIQEPVLKSQERIFRLDEGVLCRLRQIRTISSFLLYVDVVCSKSIDTREPALRGCMQKRRLWDRVGGSPLNAAEKLRMHL